ERIIPAADISEQISTAGTEASGTGNMKLSMNGALTMGTLDGANVEILAEVGEENIYIFGLTVDQISEMRKSGSYDPRQIYSSDEQIRRVLDCFSSNRFSLHEPGLFEWLYKSLLEDGDHYFHLADLPSYVEAQDRASAEYADQSLWRKKAILNVARIGRFSSDRTIREYARDVWGIKPVL
ncbi:glycogen/starch/alpha-glucan phosphorylase, partial [bacterium]|nr:glycogen/starch/alpha-glucan phosphorylase [bacterium]